VPDEDVSLTIPFLLFLTAFVLIGIYPAWQRTEMHIRNFLNPRDNSASETGAVSTLDEIEFLLLQHLARDHRHMISAKRLAVELHLDAAAVEQELSALCDQQLVRFSRPFLVRKHYRLSARGYQFAIEQGFIPRLGNGKSIS